METIQALASWWYWCYPDLANGLYICWSLAIVSFIVSFVYFSWTNKLNDEDGIVHNLLTIIMVHVMGSIFVWVLFPVVIVFGILYILNKLISNWGNNYRELEKSREKRHEENFKRLLDSDPIFKQKYDEIMNNTPKI